MPGTRLLAFARRWIDPAFVAGVVEPLVADWQREWSDAQRASLSRRTHVLLSGWWALLISIGVFAVSRLATPPPARSAMRGLVAFSAAVFLSPFVVLVLLAPLLYPGANPYPLGAWLPRAGAAAITSAIPMAMLPCLLMLRRDSGTTGWNAAQGVALGSLLYAFSTWGSVFLDVPLTAQQREQMQLRAEQNDRAGRFEYPWSAVRQARPTTPEQRAMRRAAMASMLEIGRQRARQRALAWIFSARTAQQLILVMIFGSMGWVLGAHGRSPVWRAVGWWALCWLGIFFLGRPLMVLIWPGVLRDLAAWAPTLVFSAVVIALHAGARLEAHHAHSAPSAP
jgi:hypothetical protein